MIHQQKSRNASRERWLVSYADFITLLFAFFVVLYASTQVDRNRVAALSAAIQAGFRDLGTFTAAQNHSKMSGEALRRAALLADPANLSGTDLNAEIDHDLAEEIQSKQISVRNTPDGVVISLLEVGFFESGSARLKPAARTSLTKVAGILYRLPNRLRIEGHTDSLPIHNAHFSSNWELSTARATEIVRSLVTQYGFAPDQLSATGYGEFHPVANNSSPDGRATNRRVDIVILSERKHP